MDDAAAAHLVVDGQLSGTATEVSNTASVSTATVDPFLGNNTSTAAALSDQLADVSVTKIGPPTVLAGQTVTWTVTATNHGPSTATGVVITDDLPAGITGVVLDPGCTTTPTGFTCPVGALANGASATVHVTALIPSGSQLDSLTNDARASASTADPNGANGDATVSASVGREATLTVSKTADPSPFVPGRDASYTITVANPLGPSDAAATLAVDSLEPTLAPSASPETSQGACVFYYCVLNCALVTIQAC